MNKLLKAANSKRSRVVAALAIASATFVSAAHATGVDISADVTQAKTDISTNGALVIGVIVAVAAISWIRRVIK